MSRTSAAVGMAHQMNSVTPFSFLGCIVERDGKVDPRKPPPKPRRR